MGFVVDSSGNLKQKKNAPKGASLVTGKTWKEMNRVERTAHSIARGTKFAGKQDPETLAAAQKWLSTNVGDTDRQRELAVAVRDAAADRVRSGTFGQNEDRAKQMLALADAARPASNYTGGLSLGPGGPPRPQGSTLGYETRDPIDWSGLNAIDPAENPWGEDSNRQTGYYNNNTAVRLWNPETNRYEDYAVDPNDVLQFNPKNDLTSYYTNEFGERVLGFKPSYYTRNMHGETTEIPTQFLGGTGGGTGGGGTLPPGGSGPGGSRPPGTQPPTSTQPPPVTNDPTDDWFWTDPKDYTNAPQPEGDGSFAEKGPPPDTSWNWDFFREKAPGDRQWGGYDPDYQAFERYQPGMESPWGMPNIKGGNEDFYQQQFVNQLRDEQGYQNRERAAQLRRQEALENPIEGPSSEEMWGWAYGGKGIPDVKLGGGQRTSNWELGSQFTPGQTTQDDILRWASSNLGSEDDRKWYKKHLANPNREGGDSTFWSSAGDPNKLIGFLPTDNKQLSRENQRRMTDLFNAIYNRGEAGPYAPTGYASPIQWGGEYNS